MVTHAASPESIRLVDLEAGGLATSGGSRRFRRVGYRLYGHILDPTTGWPVEGTPRSVTEAAGT